MSFEHSVYAYEFHSTFRGKGMISPLVHKRNGELITPGTPELKELYYDYISF